jgi:hypothetical protein
MSIRLDPKRPDEMRRESHDWSAFLGTDTIVSQTTTSSDVTIVSSVIAPGDQKIDYVVDGGTDGTTALITQTIVTAAGDHETETFFLPIAVDEVLTLGEVKENLGIFTSDRDRSILQMIPRARLWVEDHTGLALTRRTITERYTPQWGAIRLNKGPLVTVDDVSYLDSSGSSQTYVPRFWAGQNVIFPVSGETWPALATGDAFEITYTVGALAQNVDDRLRGAMLALIEGEFSEGYAYPPQATDAAERCCVYLRQMVA